MRRFVSWAGGLALVIVIAVLMWASADGRRGWTAARLETLIRAEVPAAADRQYVEAWLDRHGLTPMYFADTAAADRYGDRTMPALEGLRDADLGGMLRASVEGREANVGFWWSGRIGVYFFFDRAGRLVGHLVHPVIYDL